MRPASSPTLVIGRRINPYEYRCWGRDEPIVQPATAVRVAGFALGKAGVRPQRKGEPGDGGKSANPANVQRVGNIVDCDLVSGGIGTAGSRFGQCRFGATIRISGGGGY